MFIYSKVLTNRKKYVNVLVVQKIVSMRALAINLGSDVGCASLDTTHPCMNAKQSKLIKMSLLWKLWVDIIIVKKHAIFYAYRL